MLILQYTGGQTHIVFSCSCVERQGGCRFPSFALHSGAASQARALGPIFPDLSHSGGRWFVRSVWFFSLRDFQSCSTDSVLAPQWLGRFLLSAPRPSIALIADLEQLQRPDLFWVRVLSRCLYFQHRFCLPWEALVCAPDPVFSTNYQGVRPDSCLLLCLHRTAPSGVKAYSIAAQVFHCHPNQVCFLPACSFCHAPDFSARSLVSKFVRLLDCLQVKSVLILSHRFKRLKFF
jgi:hypothetical protein